MKFTYSAYKKMLIMLDEHNYQFSNYRDWKYTDKSVILRHDIDFRLEDALVFSEIEQKMKMCYATYFVLLSSNFYNISAKESREIIAKIKKNGGEIGLHFDETQYQIKDKDDLKKYVIHEKNILEQILETDIKAVSMHRPSPEIISSNIQFEHIVNSYETTFFDDMKYVSDSRCCWRENIEHIIESDRYNRLHILTHPIWYGEQEIGIKNNLKKVINIATKKYYQNLKTNIRDLDSILSEGEVDFIWKD